MKKFQKFMSYLLVAVLASMVTLAMSQSPVQAPAKAKQSKLEQLEQLILERFIGEADQTAMEDEAAAAMIDSLGDRWSYYIPAAEYSDYLDQMANSYVGIGVTIQVDDEVYAGITKEAFKEFWQDKVLAKLG